MPALLLRFLPHLIGAAVLVVSLWTVWYKVDHWCNAACKPAIERANAAEAAIQAAQERATALALLWASNLEQVEIRYVDKVRERTITVDRLRERAAALADRDPLVPLSVPALGVLSDSARLANDTPAPEGNLQPTEAVSVTTGDWVDFAVAAADAYLDAKDKHLACVAAYESVRDASIAQ